MKTEYSIQPGAGRSTPQQYRMVLSISGLFLVVAAISFMAMTPGAAYAAPGVTIGAVTPYALVDNQASTCTADTSPHAMYLQVNITNTSGSTLMNVQATLNFTTTGFALAGGQPATIYLGTLAPGAVVPVFWFVTYPCTYATAGNYLVSVADGTSGATTYSGVLTTRNELTANAGGLIENAILGPGLYVGQVVTYLVNYEFGNAWKPASSDAQIQPAGNKSFRADCFQLISDTVDSSTFIGGLMAGMNNQLYFVPVNSAGTDNHVIVTYYFRVTCVGNSSTIYPYADLQSGSQQQKYTANYGAACTSTPCNLSAPAPENSLQMSKTPSARSVSSGGMLTYTVRITNTANVPVLLDAITDTLPVGSGSLSMLYPTYQGVIVASFVQSSNSSYMPTVGSTGTIYWLSKPQQTWSIPANGAIDLIYQVQFPTSALEGTFINTATARTGTYQIGPRGYGVGFNQPTAVTLSSFGARGISEVFDFNNWPAGLVLGSLGVIAAVAIWRSRRQW